MTLNRSSSDQRLDALNVEIKDQLGSRHLDESRKFLTLGNKKSYKSSLAKKATFISSAKESGCVCFYRPSGQQFMKIPMTLHTTVKEVCSAYNLDKPFLQIGNQQIRQLHEDSKPLRIQTDILLTIGYSSVEECLTIGGSRKMTSIFCFFAGRPAPLISNGMSNVLLVAMCNVGRGRILQSWSRKRCILYNDTIRIENNNSEGRKSSEGDSDNILLLNKFRVEIADSSHGRCLKLSSSSKRFCFVFEDSSDLQQWSTHATQCSIVPNCDLSDRQLLFLPDKLFYVGSQRMITNLNLRRNSMLMKPKNTTGSPLIGWLDDVARFPSLKVLNLADNNLNTFPSVVLQLPALVELNISGNCISFIPSNIRMLQNLTSFNLSNNWITFLPKEIVECRLLTNLDLSFNRFHQIPAVLPLMSKLATWELAGNYIRSTNTEVTTIVGINKLDLRFNGFNGVCRLTSFQFDGLTVLDLRHGGLLTELDLSNLSTIQVVYCSNLKLRTIQMNGTNLRELYAEYNELTQMVVMPVPVGLTILSVAHNSLEALPEWTTELHNIVTISAHHNKLTKLPYKMFMNVNSLRHLFVGYNQLTRLPDIVENCAIEIMNCENNLIEKLPAELFSAAHLLQSLNVTNNLLTSLPAANPYADLNRIQFMRLSGNKLSETCISTIVACKKLRILDISYNSFRFFNDSALSVLSALEEINISGNRLTSLSTELAYLPHLQIIRAHSNKISSIPDISFSPALKLIDLSNNRLSKVNVKHCITPGLKFLDLTCNPLSTEQNGLQLQAERRAISVVDISKRSIISNLQFGFSETSGQRSKLCVLQIRPKNTNNVVFAMVDGGGNPEIAEQVRTKLNYQLSALGPVENPESLRRSILRTHENIGDKGVRLGASVFVIKITPGKIICASSGHITALLCRRDGEIVYLARENKVTSESEIERLRASNAIITPDEFINGVASSGTGVGYTFLYPAVVPNPKAMEVNKTDDDDFIIIGNRSIWQCLSHREIVTAVQQCKNPLQASKKIQDMCQALEQNGNLSVIIIKLSSNNASLSYPYASTTSTVGYETQSASSAKSFSPLRSTPQRLYFSRSQSDHYLNGNVARYAAHQAQTQPQILNLDSLDTPEFYYKTPKKSPKSESGRSTIRRLKEQSDSRLFGTMASRTVMSQSDILSPVSQFSQTQNSGFSSDGNSDPSPRFNQERFIRVKNQVEQELKLKPSVAYRNVVTNRYL